MTKARRPGRLDFSKKNVALDGNKKSLRCWASINESGYEVKAFVGGTELDLEQLMALNRFCAQAIEWHRYADQCADFVKSLKKGNK